ncbi:MAG: tetrathionate reductase family octaheme c-type cytochrome [Magnetospirillum sp. WYHS-4]
MGGLPTVASDVTSSTADHTKFKDLQRTFASGPEVTRACLGCHTEAAKHLMRTQHWRWEFDNKLTGQKLGKRHVVNSFCGATASNDSYCTACHVGYGWKDLRKEHQGEDNVDCLICHDTTATYRKGEGAAGMPDATSVANLTEIARKVGKTQRHNCGNCHFHGGGANGAKHGDLDNSLITPSFYLDVHMDDMGLNFACSRCHGSAAHQVQGSRYATTARDTHGIDAPGRDDGNHATCESCHGAVPHQNRKLNHHTDRVACQTCHIPEFARGSVPTKTLWDWSTAGRLDGDGKPYSTVDPRGYEVYTSKKGTFDWGRNVTPEYRWYNGRIRYTLVTDRLDDTRQPVPINAIEGGPSDPDARIWPFKVMLGKQVYDTQRKTLLVNHIAGKGDPTAFWNGFDWATSLRVGTEYAGQPFSGQWGFVETTMLWPITHMVAPKDKALACDACHSRDGRLKDLSGFHMPGRDYNRFLEWLGFLLVGGALFGVLGHAAARAILAVRRRKGGGHGA